MTEATEAYYGRIAQQYGYADAHNRGHGHSLIHIPPLEYDIDHDANSAKYCKDGERPSRGPHGVVRIIEAAEATRAAARERLAANQMDALRKLVPATRERIRQKATAAARDALIDAERLIEGQNTAAVGNVASVLPTLVRLLSRYA